MHGTWTSDKPRACLWEAPDCTLCAGAKFQPLRRIEMDHRNTITRRRFVAGLSAGAALGMHAGRASAADPITLKFATNDTTQDASYIVAQLFGADVAKRTNDKY